MRVSIVVRDDSGERSYQRSDFPLALGEHGAPIAAAASGSGAAAALIELADEGPCVTPAAAPQRVKVNGEPLDGPRPLRAGDTISVGNHVIACYRAGDGLRLVVSPDASQHTLPPDLDTEGDRLKLVFEIIFPQIRRLKNVPVCVNCIVVGKPFYFVSQEPSPHVRIKIYHSRAPNTYDKRLQ